LQTSTICCADAPESKLRASLDDPEALRKRHVRAMEFLKNANIAAGGVRPSAGHSGTSVSLGKKGR